MSIVPRREAGRVRWPSSIIVAIGLLAMLVSATDARAQVQSAGQQSCLNALYKNAGKVGQAQGKVDVQCVKAAQSSFDTAKFGNPGQELTLDACPTNDKKGSVATNAAAVAVTESGVCTATPPSFGAGSGDQIAGAAASQTRAVLRDMFGPNLTQLVLYKSAYPDKGSVGCQSAFVKSSAKLYDTLWKDL